MNYMDNEEIKITRLPMMGSPLGIGTRKQGRRGSITNIDPVVLTASGAKRLVANGNMVDSKKILLTCRTIVGHPKASVKQRAFAQMVIDTGCTDVRYAKTVYGIARNLR